MGVIWGFPTPANINTVIVTDITQEGPEAPITPPESYLHLTLLNGFVISLCINPTGIGSQR